MRVGFLNNQIDDRGTGNALYDYAHYNEVILGNESILFGGNIHSYYMYDQIKSRFGDIYGRWDLDTRNFNLDVLYHIKSGYDDRYRPPVSSIRYAVHAVFDYEPHGDRYAMVSRWLGEKHNALYVPHMIDLPEAYHKNFRLEMDIPPEAIVFGRHGGPDTFDIPWAWKAIKRALELRDDIYFIFLNTNRPEMDLSDRVIFLPPTVDKYWKKGFINTCDAMIHARSRGETFGISVGEFAYFGKPVITYQGSYEKAHLEELGYTAITYSNEDELLTRILQMVHKIDYPRRYTQYRPELVMQEFKKVFLD
jgi:hypothetical protein